MDYDDEFLEALGGWQRGWREKPQEKALRTAALVKTLKNVPDRLRSVDSPCYRKRFLGKSDLSPLILNEGIDEGISSWTYDIAFAQDFHGFWREGTFASIFCHIPAPEEVLLNIEVLWMDTSFVAAAEDFRRRNGRNSDALFHFHSNQREVILNSKLRADEVVGFTGKSSPFEELCRMAGITMPTEIEAASRKLAMAGEHPEEPAWLDPEAARRVITNTREAFFKKLR